MNRGINSKMSKIVIGTVQFGLSYGINNKVGQVDKLEVMKILGVAHDFGIRTLDTAYVYGNSEEVLGQVNASDNFKIVSKYPQCNEPVEMMFNKSLLRLHTKKLYAYIAHDFDTIANDLDRWKEFEALKKENKIERIGFSLYNVKQLQFLWDNDICFDILQFPYNIFDRQFEPFFDKLKQKKVEIHIRSVFLQGLFFKNTESLGEKINVLKPYLVKLQSYCKDNNITIEQLTLNYVLSKDKIDGVLMGVDSKEQLQTNLSKLNYTISSKDIDFVNSIIVEEKEMLNPVNW